jgi:hypothetical protein
MLPVPRYAFTLFQPERLLIGRGFALQFAINDRARLRSSKEAVGSFNKSSASAMLANP